MFVAKPKFNKKEILLEKSKYIKHSFITYIILCVLFIFLIIFAPTNDELTLEYVFYMKGNLQLVVFVSIFNSIIEVSCILINSLKKDKNSVK